MKEILKNTAFYIKAILTVPLTAIQLFLLCIFSKNARKEFFEFNKKYGHHNKLRIFMLFSKRTVETIGFLPHILILIIISYTMITDTVVALINNGSGIDIKESLVNSISFLVLFYLMIPFIFRMPSDESF